MNDLCKVETLSQNTSEYKETKTTYLNFQKIGYISFTIENGQTALYNEQNYKVWYNQGEDQTEEQFNILSTKIKNPSSVYLETDLVNDVLVSKFVFNLDKIDYIYETVDSELVNDKPVITGTHLYVRFVGSTAGVRIDYNQKETLLNEWNSYLNSGNTSEIKSCLIN